MASKTHKFDKEGIEVFNTTPDYEVAVEDIIVHKPLDFMSAYNLLVDRFPNIELVPISAGTELYSRHGDRASYVKSI